jgi:YVTN family beta-propeller protein
MKYKKIISSAALLAVTPFIFTSASATTPLAGMPPVLDQNDIYAADRPNQLSPVVANFPERVYIPNHTSNTLTEIDPKTFKIIRTIKMKAGPQHVVPSWDLKTLWVNNNEGNFLTPIDPMTGLAGKPVAVHDPYNLYFTPNGKYAVVMAESDKQVVFRDPHTMAIKKVVNVPCLGVNHADWTKDGNHFLVSCEFSGQLLWINTEAMKIEKVMTLPKIPAMKGMSGTKTPMPQDVKISPDGSTFYIADMMSDGLWIMKTDQLGSFTLLKTGKAAHGLYVTRDSKTLLITNRGEGSVSVLRFSDNALIAKWKIPGNGSPDMGGVSADGTQFWVSGRYNNVVYVFDIVNGKFLRSIKVGREPHGLSIYPQPGRYSLGHTGVFR